MNMKVIINDYLYDTDKSTLIYIDVATKRSLYKTHNGNYFMQYNNGEIVPKTLESTKEYLGKHDVEAYIKEFNEPQEA